MARSSKAKSIPENQWVQIACQDTINYYSKVIQAYLKLGRRDKSRLCRRQVAYEYVPGEGLKKYWKDYNWTTTNETEE